MITIKEVERFELSTVSLKVKHSAFELYFQLTCFELKEDIHL